MERTRQTLKEAWSRLCKAGSLEFSIKSKGRFSGFNATGSGRVRVEQINDATLVFTESGLWQSPECGDICFSNVYRWTLDRAAGVIRLEHLRCGPEKPVYLFDLAPMGRILLEAVSPHFCGADVYTAVMELKQGGISLHWRVRGPKKDQEIRYFYAPDAFSTNRRSRLSGIAFPDKP